MDFMIGLRFISKSSRWGWGYWVEGVGKYLHDLKSKRTSLSIDLSVDI